MIVIVDISILNLGIIVTSKRIEFDNNVMPEVSVKSKALKLRIIIKHKILSLDVLPDLSGVNLTWLLDSKRLDLTKILYASYFFVFSKAKSVIV